MENVGPQAHRGRAITVTAAMATQGRREHCPRCRSATQQAMEVNDHFSRPFYNYRCVDCQCIVETGDLISERARVRTAREDEPQPARVRRAREL